MSQPIQFINPPSLSSPNGFSHVSVAPAARLVFISGQVAYDGEGRIVGVGDLAAQTRQVFRNLGVALESAGSDFQRLLKLTFFVRNISESGIATIRSVRREFLSPSNLPASTMIGVAGLAKDDLLLEVEAYAAQRDGS